MNRGVDAVGKVFQEQVLVGAVAVVVQAKGHEQEGDA